MPPITTFPFSPVIEIDASKSRGLAAVVASKVDNEPSDSLIAAIIVSSASSLFNLFVENEKTELTGPKSQFRASR